MLQGINYNDPKSDDWEKKLRHHVFAHYGHIPAPMQYILRPRADKSGVFERSESESLPSCIDRCFFILSNSFYGLCPWTAKEGDVVVLLDGAAVPFLLRSMEGKEQGGKYQLVGECFVEGVNSLEIGGPDGIGEQEVFVIA